LAQSSTTGVIEGRVRDQAGNAVADATVTASANRAPSTAVTDSQGRYTLANLPPGNYKLRAEAPGKAAIVLDDVVVSISTRTRVDVALIAGQTETVTVTAEAPMVDTKSVTTGGNFKVANFIDQLPVGRNLAATLTLAPGVESGGGTGAGNYSISGSSGLENSYIVDGVNITSTGYGGIGTYNAVFGSLGTGVTYDFLEEVQVKTGGIDVEYGQATGGVVNTIVKTGSNDLSGSVAIYTGAPINEYKQGDLFIGAVNPQKGSYNDNAQYDLGLSIGGSIVKDKFFYFVAYNPVFSKASKGIQDIPLPSNISQGLPSSVPFDPTPSYPASLAGAQTQERRSDNYAAKLTWYANPNHRLEFSAFGDPSTGDLGVQRFQLRNIDFPQGGGVSEIKYGADNYTLKYDAVFTPTLFMQAHLGRHDGSFEETSALNKSAYTDDRQLRCFLSPNFCGPGQSRDNAARWANGGVGFISNSEDLNDQFKAVVTWVAGNNELKGGVSYDRIQYTDRQDYSGTNIPVKWGVNIDGGGIATATALATPCQDGGLDTTDCYVLLDTRGGVVANLRQSSTGVLGFRTTRGRYSPNPGPTETDDMAVFIQDTITFGQNWTLKAGVRAGQQEIKGEGDYTLQYYLDDGSRTPTSLRTASSVPAGSYKFDWVFAPRIGLTWDTRGDGRSKLYANAARYYERIPNDLAIRSLSNEAGFGTVTYNDWNLITGQPLAARNLGTFRGAQTRVEAGTKLPYVDEYVLGWQQELGRDVSVELRGIYREQGRSLEDVQFNSVEATENYYAGYYFGAYYTLDTLPFPNDPTFCSYNNPTGTCQADPAGTFQGSAFGEYVIANPGENTSAGFPTAVRKYYALEAILNKRFGDHWLFYGNARFSRLRGNYEGLYRNDNGQSDPNISSLFDFPATPILEGQFQSAPLNTDRPFSMKLFGSYQWDNGINLGVALNVAAGTPRTPLLAHPNGFYQNRGEVPGASPIYYWYSAQQPGAPLGTPCAAADLCLTTGTADEFFRDTDANTAPGSWAFPHLYDYAKVGRGANGRTSTETQIDLSLGWTKQFNRWATFGVGATVFNLLNSRETVDFDDDIELQAGVTNPDYLKPNTLPLSYGFQNPRSLRVYAKWSF
jgi:hypothetical protein